MSEMNIYHCNNTQKMVSNIVLQSQHFIFPLNHALSQKIMRSPELRIFFAALLWEACKIQNRLNLGHCPNLPELPPSPKTSDTYFKIFHGC
jgi:hypothetical protein